MTQIENRGLVGKVGLAVIGAAFLAAAAAPATAASRSMQVLGPTTQPIGHYELCQRRPGECRAPSRSATPVKMTRKLWAAMLRVNQNVNSAVQPRTDRDMWGVEEFWSYPATYGDCEDYVLEKRRQLSAQGIPTGNLLITVVRQPNGDGHAVLTVRTSAGDFILDNLETRILAWNDTRYTYLKRQSARSAGNWVAINDGRSTFVGSVSGSQ